MKRNWAVRPDQTGTVSREALIVALVDGATMLDLAGGVLEVVVGRAPTDVPGEMVLTGAILTWKDRTDAAMSPEAEREVVPVAEPTGDEPALIFEPREVDPENPDGFDLSTLAEEDIDEPVPTR